jgi:O-antigen/teichoic acid export membrane protein
VEIGKYLGKGIWGLADKGLPVLYGLGFVLLVIRVLPEEEFGNFILVQEIFLVISGLTTAFALQPLLKYASEVGTDQQEALTGGLILSLALTLAASAIVYAASGPLASLLNSPGLAALIPMVPLLLAASFIRNFALALLQSRFYIASVFWVDAVHFLGTPLLVWVYSRMHLFDTARDLVAINILSLAMSSLVGLAFIWPLVELRLRVHPQTLRTMFSYGQYSFGQTVSYLMYSRADSFILSAFAGPVQVAVYNSVKVFTKVFEMVTQVVQMFLLPATSRLSSLGEWHRLHALVEKAILFCTIGMLPVFLLFVFGPGAIMDIVYQGRYQQAAPLLQIFALLTFVVPVIAVGMNTLLGLGRARESFYLGVQMLAVSVVLYLLCIPLWESLGATLANVAASLVVSWLVVRRLRDVVPLKVGALLGRTRDITTFVRSRWQALTGK